MGQDQFIIPPFLERKLAFNAFFTWSMNIQRQKLASKIKVDGPSLKFLIFSSMAKEWSSHVNINSTEQLHTDEYMCSGQCLHSIPRGTQPRMLQYIRCGQCGVHPHPHPQRHARASSSQQEEFDGTSSRPSPMRECTAALVQGADRRPGFVGRPVPHRRKAVGGSRGVG